MRLHKVISYINISYVGRKAKRKIIGALLDRITHHVHIVEMNGDSYRFAQSKKKKKR